MGFKANTNDSRESASIHNEIYKNGAFLQIYDPMVSHKNIKKDIKIYWNKRLKIPLNKDNFKILDQLKNVDPKTDLFVILTEWEELKEFNFKGIKILMVGI